MHVFLVDYTESTLFSVAWKDSSEPLLRARCKACSARPTASKATHFLCLCPLFSSACEDQAEGWLTLKGPAGFLAEQGRHKLASKRRLRSLVPLRGNHN